MGIDRIGKGGLPPTAPEPTGGVEKKGAAERPFSVERAEPKERAQAGAEVDSSSPLERLRRGELDVNGYLDAKVEGATRGLEGLSASELDDVRKVLRDQLATDPGLVDLVRQATGELPDVPEE
jgi:hypothetical protein